MTAVLRALVAAVVVTVEAVAEVVEAAAAVEAARDARGSEPRQARGGERLRPPPGRRRVVGRRGRGNGLM